MNWLLVPSPDELTSSLSAGSAETAAAIRSIRSASSSTSLFVDSTSSVGLARSPARGYAIDVNGDAEDEGG